MRYRVVEEVSGIPCIENDSQFPGDTTAERRRAAEAECARLNGVVPTFAAGETPWVPGPYTYNDYGEILVAANPYGHGEMHVADLRGWGHLTGRGSACGFTEEKAAAIQDATGRMLAKAPGMMALVSRIAQRPCTVFRNFGCAEGLPHDPDRWCDPCTARAALL
ncbi:MAG: hypothetical protein IPH13_20105 [Planctomycetes bacterium]|nr:hypothetical protein [Planctomycetota bacterium]